MPLNSDTIVQNLARALDLAERQHATVIPIHVLRDVLAGRNRERCRCGCPRDYHDHYRPGTDCGACGTHICPTFRKAPT